MGYKYNSVVDCLLSKWYTLCSLPVKQTHPPTHTHTSLNVYQQANKNIFCGTLRGWNTI